MDQDHEVALKTGCDDSAEIKSIQVAWSDMLVICRKCSKKLHGGFGPAGEHNLRQVLKTGLRQAGRRQAVRIVETKCLGLCPKGAVAVIAVRSPGVMLVIPAGVEPAALLAMLPLA